MSKLASVRKFVVAAVGVAVAFGLFDEGTARIVTEVVTAVLVYIIPND